ncbi:neuropeptide CCHamide-1 receptor-like [Babylonia areolata]|uniref:neuropeptide CCHamide-1 receptor-like n=1 Tax=Babylonia areolata TaxID=304850 RepID=UPI003FD25A96
MNSSSSSSPSSSSDAAGGGLTDVGMDAAAQLLHGNSTTTSANGSGEAEWNGTIRDPFMWAIQEDPEAIFVPVIFGLIFVVGLIGNGTLIFTVVVNKVMRNVPNILIVSLSLGDFLLLLVSAPLTSTIYTFTNWPYGELACKVNHFMQTWSLGVTVFTLTALSIDRFLAIMDPMAKHKGKTQATTMAVSGGIWVLAFVLALPDAFLGTQIVYVNPPFRYYYCHSFPENSPEILPKVVYVTRFVVFFAIPVVIIATFYLLMALILIRSGQQMPCEGKCGGLNQQRQIAARKKVARIVLSFVVIFVVCWLPRHVYLLWFYLDPSSYNAFWHYFKIVGFSLTFVNSCINPFALYFLSSQFRKYYNRYLFCCLRGRAYYTRMEQSSTMHNFNSTVRRASSTNTTIVHSQSMC